MSKKILYVLGIAVTIILGTFLYLKFCCNCCMNTPTDEAKKEPVAATQEKYAVPFSLNGSGIEFQTNENLKFLKNNSTLLLPVSDSVTIGIEKLKAFLATNPKQIITITGYAASDEKNTTTFENLGFARANDIKNYFVSKGLNAGQFDLKGEIDDQWKTTLDTLFGPAAYKFETLDTTVAANDEWSVLKDKINADPLVLYFNTNKTSNQLSTSEAQKVTDIAKYMDHIKDASVLIVGHSDNVGNREANVTLAQKRAVFAKNYLTTKGIDGARITTESKGPDEPVSSNETADGKSKNRRTVITIK